MSIETPFLAQEMISLKRDGGCLTPAQWARFLHGFASGNVHEYQMSAMLMAIFFKGMSRGETAEWVKLLMKSGESLEWGVDKQQVVDKHSTGGVGDKTSLLLLPLCALEGVLVPMIAGRGLGHTGGTIDKVESIGWNTNLSSDQFQKQVRDVGGGLIGQTSTLAPLDKSLYALRDVTATVESVPLIVASILSKKLAEGLNGLVLDVKFGSGAFMPTMEDSVRLASELDQVGIQTGMQMRTIMSSMEEPLGEWSGNALELFEVVKILKNESTAQMQPTLDLSLELAANMIMIVEKKTQSNLTEIKDNIKDRLVRSIKNGRAYEKFKEIAIKQGVSAKILDQKDKDWFKAPFRIDVKMDGSHLEKLNQNGEFIKSIKTKNLGWSLVKLGAGRTKLSDTIDPWVGLQMHKKLGDRVHKGEILATVFASSPEKGLPISEEIKSCFEFCAGPELDKQKGFYFPIHESKT